MILNNVLMLVSLIEFYYLFVFFAWNVLGIYLSVPVL